MFLGGGLLVSAVCAIGLNVQALLSTRAMARPHAVQGTLRLSRTNVFRQAADRLAGSAMICVMLELTLAHLSLLGGALLLGFTARGYLRRMTSGQSST